MSTKTAVGVLIFIVALAWAGLSARQNPGVPGPGTGVATVTGTVKVGNTVPVVQSGEWKVDVANTPTVILASPSFLTRGSKYTITWADGEREVVTITTLAGEWVRADGPNQRPRWINTALVRSVEETR